ncbi:MAG: DUF2125 domain-containing protein [Pseudotabrizicola sp.]|uniref:DUF2125 domain-containing protein n=1 Tax=Pseudotabrizicola sp. TaxID=2939647 RepID=UPI002722B953|nr:DUF2125 domain-containing protein [Pseudotabrizicola sp.]MDO9639132.1 DUF2125 domain-containing protein [Pseudotabrizicola sp.]
MRQSTGAASLAILGMFLASPVMAQVTPEEVWQSWQDLGESYGQTLAADQVAREGDTLVVTGLTSSMVQDGARIDGRIDEVRFRDLANGTVEVTMTETYTIDMTMPGEDGKTQEIALVLTQPGLNMIAGGSAAQTDYSYTAPSITVDMQIREDAVTLADVDSTLTGLTGTYVMETAGDASVLDSALAIDSMAFTVTAGDVINGATAVGTLAALKLGSAGNFLGVAAMENMVQALRDGFSADVDFSYGAGEFTIDAVNEGRATKVVATNETGHFRALMGQEALRYGAGGTGVSMVMTGADIPFPELKLTYGEASFDFLVPVMASEAPVDFTFVTRIVDLAISDEIWAMFDPTVALPRDPATVILDTKGKVRLTADLMDDAAMAAQGEDAPGEIHALDVTDLTIRFAGAELTGTGGVTFDNSDLVSFDGVPAPTGKFDLLIRGGNGLLDKLVTMGVVPQDQAMGARMMIAMFAKPGDGPDVLTSTLEFRDKGFYANGQRLK